MKMETFHGFHIRSGSVLGLQVVSFFRCIRIQRYAHHFRVELILLERRWSESLSLICRCTAASSGSPSLAETYHLP